MRPACRPLIASCDSFPLIDIIEENHALRIREDFAAVAQERLPDRGIVPSRQRTAYRAENLLSERDNQGEEATGLQAAPSPIRRIESRCRPHLRL